MLDHRQVGRNTRFEDLPDVLTVGDIERFLPIGRNGAYELARQLNAIRVGRRRLIVPKRHLEEYLGLSNTGNAGIP